MHNFYMNEALKEAKKAYNKNEVPVGAIIVLDEKIIGRGHNNRENLQLATSHAEIEAINNACKNINSWRLENATIYVTLEPCPMCSGAIINARIKRLVYGACDIKSGCAYSVINLFECGFNHETLIKSGVLEEECSEILSKFFKELKNKKTGEI